MKAPITTQTVIPLEIQD